MEKAGLVLKELRLFKLEIAEESAVWMLVIEAVTELLAVEIEAKMVVAELTRAVFSAWSK
jgi:hypothetical protein